MTNEKVENIRCPVETTLNFIGGKWKALIIYYLLGGTKRFNELRRLLPAVTQRMLTRQLRDLEAHQIISRKVYPEVPPKVEYSLTEFGASMEPIIRIIQKWGTENMDRIKQVHDFDATEDTSAKACVSR